MITSLITHLSIITFLLFYFWWELSRRQRLFTFIRFLFSTFFNTFLFFIFPILWTACFWFITFWRLMFINWLLIFFNASCRFWLYNRLRKLWMRLIFFKSLLRRRVFFSFASTFWCWFHQNLKIYSMKKAIILFE